MGLRYSAKSLLGTVSVKRERMTGGGATRGETEHWWIAGRWDVNGEDQQENQYSCWVRNGEMNLQMEKEIS